MRHRTAWHAAMLAAISVGCMFGLPQAWAADPAADDAGAAAEAKVGAPAKPGWLNSYWAGRRKVTIREGFFVLGKHLEGFPVLVAVDADDAPELFAGDRPPRLAFTAADGTSRLPHEVEVFVRKEPPKAGKANAREGEESGAVEETAGDRAPEKREDKKLRGRRLRCYVRVGKLLADANTELYLYWGGRAGKDAPKSTQVWADGFRAVYHFGEPELTGKKDEVKDATKHGNDGRPEEMAVTAVGGVVGRALDGLATVEHDASLDLTQPDGFTVEAWVRWPKDPAKAHIDIVRKDLWRLYWHMIGRWQALISDDPKSRGNVLFAYTADGEAGGRWRYLAAVYEAKKHKLDLYVDGVIAQTRTIEKMGDFGGRRPLYLGVPAERNLRVLVDEVRISGVARSADWIAATHKNLAFPDKRIRIGPAEPRPNE